MAFASATPGLPSEGHMDTTVAGVVESSAPSGLQGKSALAGMVSDTADIEMDEDVEAAELADGACLQEMLCALSGFGVEDEEPLVPVQGFGQGWDHAEIDTCSTLGREVDKCVDDLLEKCAARQDDCVETCELVETPAAAGASQDFTCVEPPYTTEKRMMLQRLVSQVMQTVDAKTGIRGTDLMKRMRDLHPGLHDDMNRCNHKRLRSLLEAMPNVVRLRIENHKMLVHPVRVDAEVVSEASSDKCVVRSVVAGDQRPTQNVESLPKRRQFWSEKCRGRPKKSHPRGMAWKCGEQRSWQGSWPTRLDSLRSYRPGRSVAASRDQKSFVQRVFTVGSARPSVCDVSDANFSNDVRHAEPAEVRPSSARGLSDEGGSWARWAPSVLCVSTCRTAW